MIKAHSVVRCKCGRLYTWKQVADLGNRTKIEATIWANRQTQIKIVMRKCGALKYIYYAALGKENETHKPHTPRHLS